MGKPVARLLRPFDARVLAYDPYVLPEVAAGLGLELVDLETLLQTADVVSLHLPVTPDTRRLIGARELALMKDGALFINSARAALVDNDALKAGLVSGQLVPASTSSSPNPRRQTTSRAPSTTWCSRPTSPATPRPCSCAVAAWPSRR